MTEFYDNEGLCQDVFERLGRCWHVWTNENHEIIFRDDEDFKVGMVIMAMCAMLCPGVKILTFELMSNHIHIVIVGSEADARSLFDTFKKMLRMYFRGEGRLLPLKEFECNMRKLEDLSDCRNTIVYVNRNGYVARSDHSPFTYPWGANACFFNLPSYLLYKSSDDMMIWKERRSIAHSHLVDGLHNIVRVNGIVSPWCFCDIRVAESLFRGPAHYFFSLSKNIESNRQIASEIGESMYYTDDELYAWVTAMAFKKYSSQVKLLSRDAKIDLAKSMHFEYNASNKQIARLLKLDINVVAGLFPKLP